MSYSDIKDHAIIKLKTLKTHKKLNSLAIFTDMQIHKSAIKKTLIQVAICTLVTYIIAVIFQAVSSNLQI